MKETKNYTALQNLWYVIRTCWGASRGILYYTLAAAAIHLSANLAELLIVPAILGKVETAAPLGELLGTILVFTLALLVLNFLRTYSNYMRELFDSRLLNYYAVTINEKNCTTAYVNLLDTRYLRTMEQARAASCNSQNCAPTALLDAVGKLLTAVVGFVLYLLVLTGLPPLLVAVVAVTAAISFLISRKVNQWGYDHREERREYRGRMLYVTNTVLSNEMPKDIRIFHLQNWLLELHDKTMALHQSFCDREQLHYFLGKAVDVLLTLARNGVAYVYLIQIALEEGISVAAFLLYFGAVTGFTTWITDILNNAITIHKQSLRVSEIRELLDWPEQYRREDGVPIPAAESYELRLEDVSFRYPEADHDTISHMDLTLRPGEKLAIVGLNGAGKTTLVKLLCGLLDPTEGCVLLNGQDIRQYDRRAYYALFTAVFQDFCWLAGTVASNVAQRERDIDYEKVRSCVEKAGLAEAVEKLPQGVDTHLGKVVYDDGVELSGGQLQRLMLARALYKDAPLLVLDEPTAALDPIAENDMYQRYNELVGDRTAVYISHRLASTRFCDRILFLRDGAIAEEGDHEELMARGGGYAELFAVQSKYYREGGVDDES